MPAAGDAGTLKHSPPYPGSLLPQGNQKNVLLRFVLGAKWPHAIASRRISWVAALSHAWCS